MIYSDTNDEPQFVQNSNYFDDTSLVKKLSTKTNSFNVLSLNCQSIKVADLQSYNEKNTSFFLLNFCMHT